MTGDPALGIVPRPASTVALLRPAPGGPEVLLTHRPSTMAFAAGVHVFPGGGVDPSDADGPLAARSVLDGTACAAAWAGDLGPAEALGHAVAAVRELYEEAGVLLATTRDGGPVPPDGLAIAVVEGAPLEALAARLDLVLRTDRLAPLSRWVTPPVDTPRRYDTRFFVAALPDGAAVGTDGPEVIAHEWSSPASALRRYAAGTITLWPPTSTTLAQLEGLTGVDDVRRSLAPRGRAPAAVAEAVMPGLVRVRLGSGGGIPGWTTDAWIVGRERAVVVDPGDPTDEGLEAILGTANRHGTTIAAVAVTSARPERVAGAVALALVADVPLFAAPAAVARVGEPAQELADGTRIDAGDLELVATFVVGGEDGACAYACPDLGVVLGGQDRER